VLADRLADVLADPKRALSWDVLQQRVSLFAAKADHPREDVAKCLVILSQVKPLSSSGGHVESSQPKKHSETFPYIGEDFHGSGCRELDAPGVPVEILDMIG